MGEVVEFTPLWPEVRCDRCRAVYRHPDAEKDGASDTIPHPKFPPLAHALRM